MKRFFIFLLFVSATLFSAVCPAAAADPVVNIGGVRIRKVLFAVSPADRQECMRNKESWGLKHCLSGGRDYLAGAAKACGGLQNLPNFHLRAFSERMVLGVNGQSLGIVYQKRLRGTVTAAESEVNTEQILAAAPYQSSFRFGIQLISFHIILKLKSVT